MAATAKVLTLPTPRRSTRAFLTPEELLKVLKIARARSTRDWTMILLCYRHGMRASEVCGLKLGDLDTKSGSIRIERLKGSMTTVQPLYSHRGMPLLDELVALKAWMKERRPDGSNFVFTSQKGGKLHRSAFFRLFQSIAKSADLPAGKRNPHVLKHSCVTHLIAGNVNLALVRQAVGHRSISSTMEYVSVSDGQAAEAAAVAMMKTF
jgi:type 1 fimbriae regulatory protein FimB